MPALAVRTCGVAACADLVYKTNYVSPTTMLVFYATQLRDQPVSHNAAIVKNVLVAPGCVPGLMQFSRAVFPPGQTAWAHRHGDMYEIFYFLQGKGVLTVNGQEQHMEAGDCVVIEPGEIHELYNGGSGELVLIYFGIAVDSTQDARES